MISYPVTSANFSLAGWGPGSSVSAVTGTQQRCNVTVTAGTGPFFERPGIILTFPHFYPIPPISMAWMIGGTGVVVDIANSTTGTQATFLYMDLPVSTKTYTFVFDTLGV